MKRRLFLLIYVTFLCNCSINTSATTSEIPAFNPLKGLVIVIDPGHGGIDHGAISLTGAKEDELNLRVAQLVCKNLESSGVNVIMKRNSAEVDYAGDGNTKKLRDMKNRAEIIEGCDPDAVISIHMNKSSYKKYYGPQTYYKKDNDAGKQLASNIQDQLLANLPSYKKYRIIKGNFFILNATKTPSVLVECGFLSNKEDVARLQNEEYQQKVA